MWSGLAFSTIGLYLISFVIFLGCEFEKEETPQDIQKYEFQRRVWVAKRIPQRDAQADASMLDLSGYYDNLLPGTVGVSRHYEYQRPGIHVWGGIKFDVRGTIGPNMFETVSIPVGEKCSELDFLLGGGDTYSLDHSAAEFVIYFENGHNDRIPVINGVDVSNSMFENGVVPNNAVVWGGRTTTNGMLQSFLGFFIKKWNNPYPNEVITSIDYTPGTSGSLVAITIQPTNQRRK